MFITRFNKTHGVAATFSALAIASFPLAGCAGSPDNFERCFSVPASVSTDPNVNKYINHQDDINAVGKAAFRAYIDDQSPKTPKDGGDIKLVTGWKQLRIDAAKLLATKAVNASVVPDEDLFIVNSSDRIGMTLTLNSAGHTKAGGTVAHYPNGSEIHQNFSTKTNSTDILEIECNQKAEDPMVIVYNHTKQISGKTE